VPAAAKQSAERPASWWNVACASLRSFAVELAKLYTKSRARSKQLNCMTKRCSGSPLKEMIARFAFYCYLLWDWDKASTRAAVRQSVLAATMSIIYKAVEALLVLFAEPPSLLEKNTSKGWKNERMPMILLQLVNLEVCISLEMKG
jgi:hypothetical protein